MDTFIENVNTTAMVIGYPVIAVVVVLVSWFGTRIFRDISKIFDEMRYERWRRKHEERDWDTIESSWDLEPVEEKRSSNWEHDTDTFPAVPDQRYTTLELPELYNFQEDYHERS